MKLIGQLLTPAREQPADARRLLVQLTLWWLGNTLAGTFVNAFLYRSTHDPMVSAIYTLTGWMTYTLLVTVTGAVMKKVDRARLWQIGTAVYGAVYLMLLVMGERAGQVPWLLGVLNGLAQVIFWPANGLLIYHVTEPRSRAGFQALNGMVTSVVGMAVPPVAGFLVDGLGTDWGYRLIFAGALLFFGWAILVSFGHKPAPSIGEPFHIREAVYRSLAVPVWRSVMVFQFLFGIREGLMLFLPNLLVFVATGSEGALGSYSMVMSILGTAANYTAGWFYRGRVRSLPLVTATLLLALSPAVLWSGSGLMPLLLFSVLFNVTTPFLNVAWGTVVPALIDADPHVRKNLAEYQSLRDVATVGGRCTAIIAFLLLVGQPTSLTQVGTILLATSALILPGVALMLWVYSKREQMPPDMVTRLEPSHELQA